MPDSQFNALILNRVIWVLFAVLATLTAAGQVIPESRNFTSSWRVAGYPGEIPSPDRIVNVRDFGAVGNGVANDWAAVNAAMASLGTNAGVIFFPAGTYYMDNFLTLRSGMVLRGERSGNTTLRFYYLHHLIVANASPTGSFQPLLSGYDLHSNQVTVADASGFQAGDYAEIRETNDASWASSDWASYCVGQIVQIAAVAGNTLTLSVPLRLQYQVGLKPEIRKFTPIREAGVENLRIERLPIGDSTSRNNRLTISFIYAARCWVRGVETTNDFGGGICFDSSTQCEATGCYIHHAYEFDGGGSGYGVRVETKSGECLVENSIFQKLRHSMLLQAGVNGNVMGYNYSREQYKNEGTPTSIVGDMVCHGNYVYANLFEGNCGAYISIDSSHGMNGPYNTFFRNRARFVQTVLFWTYGGLEVTDSLCRDQTFVGNEDAGHYSISCSGLFEYGNNNNGTIRPTGTSSLADYSYYLGTNVTVPPPKPDWWTLPGDLRVYGPTNAAPVPPVGTERDIPARARWNAGGSYTVGPPSIWRQPTNQAVARGMATTFAVAATGTPVAVYQWRRNGANVGGATNAILQISYPRSVHAGVYDCVVSDSNGWMRTASATLTVAPYAPQTLILIR